MKLRLENIKIIGKTSVKHLNDMKEGEDISFDELLTNLREKMKNSSPKKLSADSRPTVGRLLANCWPHVGNLLAKCRLRTLVEYQKSLSSQERTLHIDAK